MELPLEDSQILSNIFFKWCKDSIHKKNSEDCRNFSLENEIMSLPCSYFLKSSLISANPPFFKARWRCCCCCCLLARKRDRPARILQNSFRLEFFFFFCKTTFYFWMNLHRRLIWEPISLFLTNLVSQIVDRVVLHQLTVSRTAPGSCLFRILISKNVSYKIKNESLFHLWQVQWKDQLHV